MVFDTMRPGREVIKIDKDRFVDKDKFWAIRIATKDYEEFKKRCHLVGLPPQEALRRLVRRTGLDILKVLRK